MEDKTMKLTDLDKSLFLFLDIDKLINNESVKSQLSDELIECLNKYKSIDCSIFSCYNFLDEPENGILNHSKFNNCLFVKILKLIEDKDIILLKELIEKIKEESNKDIITEEEYILTFLLLFNLYLKENIWGPSSIYIKETEKVDYKEELYKFENNYFNRLKSNEVILKEKEIYDDINILGEDIYKHSDFIIFFYLPLYFIYNFKKDKELAKLYQIESKKQYFSLILWKIRILNIWNKLVLEPVDFIYKEIQDLYKEFDLIENNIDTLTMGKLFIEKTFYYIKYYQYKKCDFFIEKSKEKLNLDISLTGKIGKKTKYQTFSNPILVVDVKNKDFSSNLHIDNIDNNGDNNNNNISLDSVRKDNPLLEKPTLVDPEEEKLYNSQIITIKTQLYLCALLNYLKRGLPDEDINREIILTYTEKGLKKSFDWLVFSKLLLHRSLAESKSTKKIERSLLQIETLCNQYNDRFPIPYERMKYSFIIDYPMIFNLKKKYAESYMGYGALKTAYSIFKELFMYEEAIKCLYASNNREEAQKLAKEVLSKTHEPGIYCILGELENNPDLFNKALEITNNKFPRALRCLGRYYYCFKKDNSKAKEYYEKAMTINPTFPNIWFTLGMIYLSEKNFNKSIVAFSKYLSNDDSNGEVWGNLGVCFMQINKFREASKCFEEGYLKSKNNWQMLDNLIISSIENKDLSKIIFSIEEFYNASHSDKIKSYYFFIMTKLFLDNYKNFTEHDKDYISKKIYSLFYKYCEIDGLRPEIWDLYANFFEEIEINKKGSLSELELKKYYKFIIDLRIKEIRTLVVKYIDFEKNQKIKDIIISIIGIIRKFLEKISDEKDYVNDKVFYVNGMENKIKSHNNQ